MNHLPSTIHEMALRYHYVDDRLKKLYRLYAGTIKFYDTGN